MIDFINRFFKRETSSGTAKERLRLVLLSDRISLAPDVIEALKADLLGVLSRYVEVDEQNTEINFENRDREVAMLANIPILSLRPRPPSARPPEPPAPIRHNEAPPPLTPQPAATVAIEEPPAVKTASAKATSAENRAARRQRQRAQQKTQPHQQSFGTTAQAT